MKILDLYCGAGGAAKGYADAGFTVVGVDIAAQPNYPYGFWQEDALHALTHRSLLVFDAIHASPPCQHYSQATAWRGNRDDHPDLIGPTRSLLEATGLPYVIENVEAARNHLHNPTMICGDDVGLPIYRRRYFETNWPLHVLTLARQHELRRPFEHKQERAYADAMECGWMTSIEAREAIPPAYTRLIGDQLAAYLAT